MARRYTFLGSLLPALGLLLLMALPATGQVPSPAARFYLAERDRPALVKAWEESPTLRRQCARIEAAGVIVSIIFRHPEQFDARLNATSHIIRQNEQVKFVRVALKPGSQWVASLAHELEHVIEQIDGVDLASLARARRGEAWQVVAGTFETRRAQEAGLRVREELKQGASTILALEGTASGTHSTPE